MFAIQDIQGAQFQGTLEQLYKVRPVLKSERVHFSLPGEELPDNTQPHDRPHQAAAAYRKALKLEQEREQIYHVDQIMHRKPSTVPPDMMIGEAWTILQRQHVKQLPVVDGDDRVVGLLTANDLLERIIVTGEGDLLQVPPDPIREVMTTPVITADPLTDIRRIARVMADYQFPAIPIVAQDGHILGIVTRGDILRKFANTPPLQLWS